MVKLFLVIVGVKESAFPVDIDTTESVGGPQRRNQGKEGERLEERWCA